MGEKRRGKQTDETRSTDDVEKEKEADERGRLHSCLPTCPLRRVSTAAVDLSWRGETGHSLSFTLLDLLILFLDLILVSLGLLSALDGDDDDE